MKPETIQRLIEINNTFYRDNAVSFSNTRSKPWEGWVRGLEILEPLLLEQAQNNAPLQVADFAAGNLRFEKFLLESRFCDNIARVYAVDNCEGLLPADMANFRDIVQFTNCDILEALISGNLADLPKSDLTVSFGFLHHIPSHNLRLKFTQCLIQNTTPAGYIFISFWGFANNERSRERSRETTAAFLETHHAETTVNDLEDEDYFLGWQNLHQSQSQNSTCAFRYCHNFTDLEVEEIVRHFAGLLELVADFKADGKGNDQNRYLILRRR